MLSTFQVQENTTIHVSGIKPMRIVTWQAHGNHMRIERATIPSNGQSHIVFDNTTEINQEYALNDFNGLCPCRYTFVETGMPTVTKSLRYVYLPVIAQ
mgnify:CR=1 FL=1